MIIYRGAHTTYLPALIAHRLTRHREEEAVLLVSSVMKWGAVTGTFPHVKDLEVYKIFDKVILCDVYPGYSFVHESEERIEQEIVKGYDEIFASNDIDPYAVEAFYNMADCEGEFSVYLDIKKIPYYFLEMTVNQFYNVTKSHYGMIAAMRSQNYGNVIKRHFGLCARGDYAIPLLRKGSDLSHNMLKNKDKIDVFSYQDALAEITPEEGSRIVKAYHFSWQNPKEEKTCITIMQSKAPAYQRYKSNPVLKKQYPNAKPEDIFHLANQIAFDYCVDSDTALYMKLHPNVVLREEHLEQFYNKAATLGIMPVDFYPFVPEVQSYQFDQLLCFGSTANKLLGDTYKSTTMLTLDYWSSFHLYHRLGTALRLVQAVSYVPGSKLYCHKVALSQVNVLAQRILSKSWEIGELDSLAGLPEKAVVFVNQVQYKPEILVRDLLNAPEDAIIILLNGQEDNSFCTVDDDRTLANMVPIEIKKEMIKEKSFDHGMPEVLYLYSKDKQVLQDARRFTMNLRLNYLGLHLMVDALNEVKEELLFTKLRHQVLTQHVRKIERQLKEISGKHSEILARLGN